MSGVQLHVCVRWSGSVAVTSALFDQSINTSHIAPPIATLCHSSMQSARGICNEAEGWVESSACFTAV